MTWSYRVIRETYDNDEIVFSVHSVYYDEDGNIKGWSEDPTYASGGNIEELKRDLERYSSALDKPVLEVSSTRFGDKLVEVK